MVINRVNLEQWYHRVSTPREETGRGPGFFPQIEPNHDPCRRRTVPCQFHGWGMPGRWAGSSIAVYARVKCWEAKTGQEKVPFYILYCKEDSLFRSSYYLSMQVLLHIHSILWSNMKDYFTSSRLNHHQSKWIIHFQFKKVKSSNFRYLLVKWWTCLSIGLIYLV